MKKTLVSLAAASLIVTSAMAADKGIDIVTTGQAAVYYNTLGNNATGGPDLFDGPGSASNKASYGIQLNLNADLKNDFTFGSTINYLGTLGLEKNVVGATMQNTNAGINTDNIADDIYFSQLYIAKKLGNTTIKLGRQELPKSLSPFAYSEGWNIFKNTFEAALVVNTDIPDTTLVGAYVSKGNGNGFGNDMSSFTDLTAGGVDVQGTAYLLTVQNKSIPMTTVTASYYDLADLGTAGTDAYTHLDATDTTTYAFGAVVPATAATELEGATILWGDVAIASKDFPMGLKVGVQGGTITTESSTLDDTTAYGVKVDLKPIKELALCVAYTSVDDGQVAVTNTTGVKTPLYTQMIANQGAIQLDNDTYMLKGVYNAGDYGKVILMGTMSTDNGAAGNDLTDIELVYKFKAASVNFLAAYISQDYSETATNGFDHNDIVRVVARYNF